MIFKQLYETKLTTANIESWIDAKMSKSTGLFGIREYSAKAKEDGFMIRKRRLTKADVFYPRVIAKYCKPSTRTMLSIRIIPSYTSIIFFSFFIPTLLYSLLFGENYTANGQLIYDFNERMDTAGLLVIVFSAVIYWSVIRPMYKTRSWIISELKLHKVNH